MDIRVPDDSVAGEGEEQPVCGVSVLPGDTGAQHGRPHGIAGLAWDYDDDDTVSVLQTSGQLRPGEAVPHPARSRS